MLDFRSTSRHTTEITHERLTDERNGFREELRQVLAPVIRDGDLLVLEVPVVLEHVGQVGGHVQDVLDVVLAQDVQVGGVFGTAQVQIGQDLDWERWLVTGQRAALGLGGAARFPVRLAVGAVRADPQTPEPQDGRGRRAARTGAVQTRLAVLWILSLKLVKPSWITHTHTHTLISQQHSLTRVDSYIQM